MGMDLIGFMAVGPAKLKLTDRTEAFKRARRRIAFAKAYVALLDGDGDENGDERRALLDQMRRVCDFDPDWYDLDEESDPRRLADLSVAEVDKTLRAIWDGDARDVVYHDHPRDPARRIVVAGEGSWGDSPSGRGYTALLDASLLGLFPYYGIQ